MFGIGGGVWGLDIGDSALKAAKLAKQGNQLSVQDFQVIKYQDLATEPGMRKQDLVFQALMRFFDTAERVKAKYFVSIPSQNVFSRFIGLPPVDRRRIPEIVHYEARQQIPFDLSEVVWDYQLVRPDFVPGEEIEIGLFAVKREVVNAFLQQFAMAQHGLLGVQIAPLALYNFVRRDKQIEEATVVIDIGAQSTDLIVCQGSKFWLRNLPIASNSFNAILEKKFNITPEEAENVKVRMAQSKHRRKVFDVLKPVLKDLVAEIQRSIGYYKSLARDVKFDEILVLGEGFKLYGLHRFLSDQLQYRIRPLRGLREIVYAGPQDREEEFRSQLPALAVALGLGIQGHRQSQVQVDLMPEDFVLRREISKKRIPAAVAAVLLWLAVLCMYGAEKEGMKRIQDVGSEGEETVAQVRRLEGLHANAKAAVKMESLNLYRDLGRCRDYWSQALAGLAQAIPTNPPIYIDSVDLVDATGALGARDRAPYGDRFDRDPMGAQVGPMGAQAGSRAFRFVARTDLAATGEHLRTNLIRSLENARIYPERVKLFSEVIHDRISIEYAGARRDARIGVRREEVEAPAPGASRGELKTTVTAILRPISEIAKEIDDHRAKREAEAKTDASARQGRQEARKEDGRDA